MFIHSFPSCTLLSFWRGTFDAVKFVCRRVCFILTTVYSIAAVRAYHEYNLSFWLTLHHMNKCMGVCAECVQCALCMSVSIQNIIYKILSKGICAKGISPCYKIPIYKCSFYYPTNELRWITLRNAFWCLCADSHNIKLENHSTRTIIRKNGK